MRLPSSDAEAREFVAKSELAERRVAADIAVDLTFVSSADVLRKC